MWYFVCLFFFKHKTAYEMRISDWSSDVCSSDLARQRSLLDCRGHRYVFRDQGLDLLTHRRIGVLVGAQGIVGTRAPSRLIGCQCILADGSRGRRVVAMSFLAAIKGID